MKATPIWDVKWGSSLKHSAVRPQRGSRAMFKVGEKKVNPSYRLVYPFSASAAWYLALASSDMATAISFNNAVSHMEPKAMGLGKTVAFPARATPWRHSLHQS